MIKSISRYKEGALVSDGHAIHDADSVPTGRRRDYVPSSEPGSRLPHMKMRLLSSVSDEVCWITLLQIISLLVILFALAGRCLLCCIVFTIISS